MRVASTCYSQPSPSTIHHQNPSKQPDSASIKAVPTSQYTHSMTDATTESIDKLIIDRHVEKLSKQLIREVFAELVNTNDKLPTGRESPLDQPELLSVAQPGKVDIDTSCHSEDIITEQHPFLMSDKASSVSITIPQDSSSDASQESNDIDSAADLCEFLNVSEEIRKENPSRRNDKKIVGFRVYRHALPATATADILNDIGYRKAAACYILLSAGIGCFDGIDKVGQCTHDRKTCLVKKCQSIHQLITRIGDSLPDRIKLYGSKLYYYCFYTAVSLTMAADILRHLSEAKLIDSVVTITTACPSIIIYPTIIIAGVVMVNPDSLHNAQLPEPLKFIKVILQRVCVHGGIGTISGDVLGYLGCPVAAVYVISSMALIGLLEGLDECGEILKKSSYSKQKGQYFKNSCLTVHQLHQRLEKKPSSKCLNQFHKSYRIASLCGSIGTICGDLASYLGPEKNRTVALGSAAAVTLCVTGGVVWSFKDTIQSCFSPRCPTIYGNRGEMI